MNGQYPKRIFRVLQEICRTDIEKRRTQGFQWIAEREIGGVFELAVRIPVGYSAADVERVAPQLAAVCGAPVEIKDRAGAAVIRVCAKPLPKLIPFNESMLQRADGGILIGYNPVGKPVYFNFRPHPHILIGGETGMGKTDLIRMIILSLLYPGEPVEINIVDMKAMSFMPFRGVRGLRIARDIDAAHDMIKETVQLVRDRGEELWVSRRRHAFQTKRVLIIDEAAELSPAIFKTREEKAFAGKIESNISTVARLGRECGVHLVYATQYPTAKILDNQIKINCGARVSFYVPNATNSEVVLDRSGAEKLPESPGRLIYKNTGYTTLQVPYVGGDEAWEKVLAPYKEVEVIKLGDTGSVQTPADGDNGAVIEIAAEQVQVAGEKMLGTIKGSGARWTRRVAQDGEHGESLAAHQEGAHEVGADIYDVSFDEPAVPAFSANC